MTGKLVADILKVAQLRRLTSAYVTYIGCGNDRNFIPLVSSGLGDRAGCATLARPATPPGPLLGGFAPLVGHLDGLAPYRPET
jgi:hypothetical protein